MSEPKPRCGAQTELVRSRAARISRCACGTIHLHLPASQVTLHLDRPAFDELARTVQNASQKLGGDAPPPEPRPRDPNVN